MPAIRFSYLIRSSACLSASDQAAELTDVALQLDARPSDGNQVDGVDEVVYDLLMDESSKLQESGLQLLRFVDHDLVRVRRTLVKYTKDANPVLAAAAYRELQKFQSSRHQFAVCAIVGAALVGDIDSRVTAVEAVGHGVDTISMYTEIVVTVWTLSAIDPDIDFEYLEEDVSIMAADIGDNTCALVEFRTGVPGQITDRCVVLRQADDLPDIQLPQWSRIPKPAESHDEGFYTLCIASLLMVLRGNFTDEWVCITMSRDPVTVLEIDVYLDANPGQGLVDGFNKFCEKVDQIPKDIGQRDVQKI